MDELISKKKDIALELLKFFWTKTWLSNAQCRFTRIYKNFDEIIIDENNI